MSTDTVDIAVVGLAGRFPGAPDVTRFWHNLRAGTESIRHFTDDELLAAGVAPELVADPRFVKAWGALEDAELFDARFFGYGAREAALLDPQHRIFLECAWEALEDAGHTPASYPGSIGVYAGASLSSYLLAHLLPGRGLDASADGLELLVANDKDYLASRVSYKLDLDGPAVCVQSACSTSLLAVHQACQALLADECDLALAGGVTVRFPQTRGYLYQEGMILSPDGHCRPFDAQARGTVSGSGAGVVVLRRLDDALADGDRIDAVIRATAANNDGAAKVGYTAPSIQGQARVVSAAIGLAGVHPESIKAIEAHGTGTALGDPIEIAALTKVFQRHTDRRGYCAVSSVKSNIGHLDSAAGIASLIKAVLQLKHGELVPNVNYTAPNPEIDFAATPFRVNEELQPWKANGDPRRIGVSSFGFGGTNVHAILEEPPARELSGTRRDRQLIVVSARSAAALDTATDRLATAFADADAPDDAPELLDIADAAWTLQTGRAHFPHRRAVVVDDVRTAAGALGGGEGPRTLSGRAPTEEPEVAWLFPGQGSQYPGMGAGLYRTEPVFRAEVDRCAEVLTSALGFDLRDLLVAADPTDRAARARLADTAVAQPALFTVEYAMARLLTSWGVRRDAAIGHSVGEFTAATLAGVFEPEEAVRLVAERGRLMGAQPTGAMLSVALPADELAGRLPVGLDIAAYNAPEVCVVAGTAEDVQAFAAMLEADGVGHRMLHTSHAFHSRMMDAVVGPFAAAVAAAAPSAPTTPILSGRTGTWLTGADAASPEYWSAQLREPVRFADGMVRLREQGTGVLVEVGPGTTLCTLARLAPEARGVVAVPTMRAPDADGSDEATALEAVGRLWLGGVEIDWGGVQDGAHRRRVALPTYPFERRRYFVEAPTTTGGTAPGVVVEDADDIDFGEADTRPSLTTVYLAPRTDVERRIAVIWQDLLGVAPIGVDDIFIELGGHSLLATKVVSRIQQDLGVEVPLRRLVTASTVAALAEVVAELLPTAAPTTAEPVPVADDEMPVAVPDWEHLHEPFGLSEIQQAQWIGRMGNFSMGNVGAHMYWEVDRDDLDVERLNQAWNRVLARHAMLRAVFTRDGHQRVLPEVTRYDFPVVDLRDETPEVVEGRLAEMREAMSHEMRPEDAWPLFEIRVVHLPGGRTRLFLSFELMMADMGSVRILLADWRAYYERPAEELPELGISFRDYRLAAEKLKETSLYRRSMDYWRERVATLPSPPELPLATSPELVREPKFVPRSALIPAVEWNAIKREAATHGVTPSAVLLAAYACVLGGWTRSGRFTLNVTTNIRLPVHPDVEHLVGGFASFTLLPVDLVEDDSILGVARRLQEQNWEDLEYRYVNGVDILRELARQRGGTDAAMMPAVFTSTLVNESEANESSMVDWLGQLEHQVIQTPQVWIDAAALEVEAGLVVGWPSVDELFPDGLVEQMFGGFVDVLRRLGSGSGWTGPAEVSPAGLAELVAGVNATQAPIPSGLLWTRLVEHAKADPDGLAVVASGRRLTFGELFTRASFVAHRLVQSGVTRGDRVAVVIDKSVEQIVAVLAVGLAGAAYVPVDPSTPPDRQEFVLSHADCAAVLLRVGATEHPDAGLPVVVVDADDEAAVADDPPAVATQVQPNELAYIIYTSGSTGRPKGVAISHQAAVNTCVDVNHRYTITAHDAVLGLSALSFDLSVWDIFGALATGATLVLPEPAANRDPARWHHLITEHHITIWNSVPALMAMLVEHLEATHQTAPTLRRVLLSGDWIPTDLPTRIHTTAPNTQVTSLGGATEAAIWSILHDIDHIDPTWDSIPYGKPMTNQTIHVLNDRHQECPTHVTGHLHIGGTGLADGYHNDPDKTTTAFITHPTTGQRLYHTGDLGRRHPDGTIEFAGRNDHQVKIGGYRIELGDIEHALASHPGVDAAVAIATGDRHHRRLAAYVVAGPEHVDDPDLADGVRAHAATLLPPYMIPSTITVLDALPLTPNGKVDRNNLPEPGVVAVERERGELTPLAVRLCQIAAHAIGVDEVDPWANFFQLGGDSIIGVRIITQVNDQGIDLRLQDLFEAQSIVDLAERLEARGAVAAAPGGGVAATRVTPFQRRLLAVAAPGLPAGAHRVDLHVEADLCLDAAREAVRQIVARHPALRTRFAVTGDDGWCQAAVPAAEVSAHLPVIELGTLPAEVRAEAVAQMVDEMREELDVERGMVFAAAVFDLGADGRVLTLLGSELVVDATSWEVVVSEFLSITQQLRNGDSVVLAPPTDPFTRWAEQSPQEAGVVAVEPAVVPGVTPHQAVSRLTADETERLTDAVRRGYRLSLTETALAALTVAARRTGLDGPLLVVGDRRDDGTVDTSRTVGAVLSVAEVPGTLNTDDLAVLLPAVKQWSRSTADGAYGPGRLALHVLERFGERSRLARLLPPGNPAPWPRWERDSLGAAVRLTVVDYAGALHIHWSSADPTVDLPSLADAFETALRDIAAHSRDLGSGQVSAGDFPLADLGTDDLAAVLDDMEEEL
ncbi:non-ribosomal peptide synthetase/type I polyketide synthase [Micromonospora sp. WMMD1155]|uniref:non-ribosomal peptide synthetase/type I polyketide synthase n=1 Tax=Micromonospora sp. WMMD1155 TaxID=3016094 RepID=UPI00249B054D|nr:non-ribosomal peptide synthetase/type I polyketide synthase [Micromonospora sp. WMMD1155]WFE54796.1 amino acid adenylation domain-containing protein [Micromonospora sp. WMMD1155]